MKLQLFSIHDEIADAFMTPFFMSNRKMAQRVFSDCINDPDHQFSKNPLDYTLYHLGEFDDDVPLLTALEVKVNLGNGNQFVIRQTNKTDEMPNKQESIQ